MKPAADTDKGAAPEEGSLVRERTQSRPPSSPELRLSREQRLEQKLFEAEQLLSREDPRRRLLQAAAMRLDEGLVDAILSTLREAPKSGVNPTPQGGNSVATLPNPKDNGRR
ncbi:MAG: hypothetical protein QM756_46200 [Polyangiaceae bacterium]